MSQDHNRLTNRINSILKLLSSASQQLWRAQFVRSSWDPGLKLIASVREVSGMRCSPDVIRLTMKELEVKKRRDRQARED